MIGFLLPLALGSAQPVEVPVDDEATTEAPAADYDYPTGEAVADEGAEAAAAAAAEAAQASRDVLLKLGKPYWESDNWEVLEREHDCVLSNFEVSVAYDYRMSRIELSFGDPSIKSLRKGEVRPIRLAWMNGADDGKYGELIRMTADPIPEENPRVTIMRGRPALPDFLDKFAEKTDIGFMTESGVVINGWSLKGSAPAVSQLRKCALAVSVARPSDPFSR